MLNIIWKDRWTCVLKLEALSADWKRLLKKFPRSRSWVQPVRCSESNQDYLCVHVHVGKDRMHGVMRKEFAVVHDERRNLYITSLLNYTQVAIHTSHFFERYRERTNRLNLSIDQTIGEYFYNTLCIATIYISEQRIVFAIAEGICLCEYDVNDCNKLYFRTFVSYDMLKQTQEQAWRIVQNSLLQIRNHSVNAKDPGSPKWLEQRERLISSLGYLDSECAMKIYSQYFEH